MDSFSPSLLASLPLQKQSLSLQERLKMSKDFHNHAHLEKARFHTKLRELQESEEGQERLRKNRGYQYMNKNCTFFCKTLLKLFDAVSRFHGVQVNVFLHRKLFHTMEALEKTNRQTKELMQESKLAAYFQGAVAQYLKDCVHDKRTLIDKITESSSDGQGDGIKLLYTVNLYLIDFYRTSVSLNHSVEVEGLECYGRIQANMIIPKSLMERDAAVSKEQSERQRQATACHNAETGSDSMEESSLQEESDSEEGESVDVLFACNDSIDADCNVALEDLEEDLMFLETEERSVVGKKRKKTQRETVDFASDRLLEFVEKDTEHLISKNLYSYKRILPKGCRKEPLDAKEKEKEETKVEECVEKEEEAEGSAKAFWSVEQTKVFMRTQMQEISQKQRELILGEERNTPL